MTDIMAFGAHPDDIEIGCAGTLIKQIKNGKEAVLVDLTQGEMGTRGTVETREKEANKSKEIIGAKFRENLKLPDGKLEITEANKLPIINVIRKYKPEMLLIPYFKDRHPDHYISSELIYQSAYLAGLQKIETEYPAFRPKKILYYTLFIDIEEPSFIIDISDEFKTKMEAIYSFESQFKPNDNFYAETKLTSRSYNRMLEYRMGYIGSIIGADYGEAFLIKGTLNVEDVTELNFSSF
jgi:bacillithiol biosynthesis deacetylase BshB1